MNYRIETSHTKLSLGALFLAIVFLCGCEDVIRVDLKTTAPRLVIEGKLSNIPSQNYFIISRTTDFYSPSRVVKVSGATIIVSDDAGNVDTLVEITPGEYFFVNPNPAVTGRTYSATVTVEEKTYTASTTMQPLIPIDTLRFEYEEDEEEGYQLIVDFQDVPNRSDYARIKIDSNSVSKEGFFIYDGRYSDGNMISYEEFPDLFELGDTVRVELHSMDRTMYFYFLTLWEVWASEMSSGLFDATPANPNTNWSGGALGYFGAFNISQRTAIIQDLPQK